MMTKKILIAALLACAFSPALAEETGDEEQAHAERRIVTRTGDVRIEVAGPIVTHPSKLVRNAPYSAEMVSERIQTLADGNQIVHKSSTMYYRDSAGRTRTEMRNNEGEIEAVTIHDPAEGTRYVLRPRDKTAIKVSEPNADALASREQARAAAAAARAAAEQARAASAQARIAAEQARAKVEELRREGKLPEGASERMIVKQVERSGSKDVQIRIAQVGPVAAQLGPVVANAIGERKWSSKSEVKELGTRDFNGVKANGTLRSYEIPAGEIGNRNPIVVSTETWTSSELQAVVYQKRSDPRSGEANLRLEQLRREEPAAALFAVPSDYTVKDPTTLARAAAEKAAERAAAARAKTDSKG